MKKTGQVCCVCGNPKAMHFKGKYYCNKHWLRMYAHGTPELVGRKSTNQFEVVGDLLTITTANGVKILADASDLDKLQKYSWCISKTGYPVANINGKVTKIGRYIMGLQDPGLVIDHINNDPLDNRRDNMRICTAAENARNKTGKQEVNSVGKTKFGKFRARIMIGRKEVNLGHFDTYEEAVEARIEGEKKYHGQYGRSFNSKDEILEVFGEL